MMKMVGLIITCISLFHIHNPLLGPGGAQRMGVLMFDFYENKHFFYFIGLCSNEAEDEFGDFEEASADQSPSDGIFHDSDYDEAFILILDQSQFWFMHRKKFSCKSYQIFQCACLYFD